MIGVPYYYPLADKTDVFVYLPINEPVVKLVSRKTHAKLLLWVERDRYEQKVNTHLISKLVANFGLKTVQNAWKYNILCILI